MDRLDDRERRVAQRAHAIWEREGRPEGRAEAHWELACEEIAIQDNLSATLQPNPLKTGKNHPAGGEPVEPVLAVENLGDLPALSDQDRNIGVPGRPSKRRG